MEVSCLPPPGTVTQGAGGQGSRQNPREHTAATQTTPRMTMVAANRMKTGASIKEDGGTWKTPAL